MAVTVDYKFTPGPLQLSDQPSAELNFIIAGTSDPATAQAVMLGFAPTTYGPLVVQSSDVTALSDNYFEGQVRYGLTKAPEPGDEEYTFDIGFTQQKITQSLATVQVKAPPTLIAADFHGAIGVTKDGVEGCDIPLPTFSWTEKHFFAPRFVTPAYIQAVYSVAEAPVNSQAFRGFAAGQVLFGGASGGGKQNELVAITFKFTASKNVSNQTIGEITGINKKGWEYLWVRYHDTEDATSKTIVKRPIQVNVERVLAASDFSALRIGA